MNDVRSCFILKRVYSKFASFVLQFFVLPAGYPANETGNKESCIKKKSKREDNDMKNIERGM